MSVLFSTGHEIGSKGFWTNEAECDSVFCGRHFGLTNCRSRDIRFSCDIRPQSNRVSCTLRPNH